MPHTQGGHDPRYEAQALGSFEHADPFVHYYSICGQPSVFPSHVWYTGKPKFSLPIPARLMYPLQPDPLIQQYAPWVPHTSPVDGSYQTPITPSRTSDIPYIRLKAPKF